jgi:hypothetical protein
LPPTSLSPSLKLSLLPRHQEILLFEYTEAFAQKGEREREKEGEGERENVGKHFMDVERLSWREWRER